MNHSMKISKLTDLLKAQSQSELPMFVSLCARCGTDNNLLDNIINKMVVSSASKLQYVKLTGQDAQQIKEELKQTKNPVTLLLYQEEIQAIFTGMVAQYRLEEALNVLNTQTQNHI